MVDDFVDLGTEEMLHYDPYEDESQNVDAFPSLDEDPRLRRPALKCQIITPEGVNAGQRPSG